MRPGRREKPETRTRQSPRSLRSSLRNATARFVSSSSRPPRSLSKCVARSAGTSSFRAVPLPVSRIMTTLASPASLCFLTHRTADRGTRHRHQCQGIEYGAQPITGPEPEDLSFHSRPPRGVSLSASGKSSGTLQSRSSSRCFQGSCGLSFPARSMISSAAESPLSRQ